jgi:hypothetical protein
MTNYSTFQPISEVTQEYFQNLLPGLKFTSRRKKLLSQPQSTLDTVFTAYAPKTKRKYRKGTQLTLRELITIQTNGSLKALSEEVRAAKNSNNSDSYRTKKHTLLPVVICSKNGRGSKKEFLHDKAKWNGVMSYDLDCVKGGKTLCTDTEAQALIKSCPYVLYACPSVSNQGYAVFVRITKMPNCDEAQNTLFNHINLGYFNGKLDPGRKDITGCRYISHIEPHQAYVNHDVIPFECADIPYKTDEEMYYIRHPFMKQLDDYLAKLNRKITENWHVDGRYQQPAHLEYSYMGQPYGKLLLVKIDMPQ